MQYPLPCTPYAAVEPWFGEPEGGIAVDVAFLLTVGSFVLTAELSCLQLCLGASWLTI